MKRGQSAAFLRRLRRKHHLGEFKRHARGDRGRKRPKKGARHWKKRSSFHFRSDPWTGVTVNTPSGGDPRISQAETS